MALAIRYLKFRSIPISGLRTFSNTTNKNEEIKKSVFISQSKDIFTNLALEDWLYHNFDFKNHHILMLWQSDPCVVIGRHQNPWVEANVAELPKITECGVQLVRRNSGGGTVYHDNGNLNMTFFTPCDRYNLKYNLEIVARSLFRNYNLKIDISPRNDLTYSNYKVSGTASRLGRPNSYHHCTLLVGVNKVDLSLALQNTELEIKTNATKSVRSKILNLCEENPKLNVKDMMKSIGWEYLRTHPLNLLDGGMELANQQKGFQMVNPTEEWFPGLNAIRNKFASWQWCFGKTPTFNISKIFRIPNGLVNDQGISGEAIRVTMTVEAGKITDVILNLPPAIANDDYTVEQGISGLIGQRFSEHTLYALELLLGGVKTETDRFVTDCLRQVMFSA